jgi:hypothetical protein
MFLADPDRLRWARPRTYLEKEAKDAALISETLPQA